MRKNIKNFGLGTQTSFKANPVNAPNHSIKIYMKDVIDNAYYGVKETKAIRKILRLDHNHHLAVLFLLSIKEDLLKVSDLKKLLTCSDRQSDIVIKRLIDDNYITQVYSDNDKRVVYLELAEETINELSGWVINILRNTKNLTFK